MKLAVSLALVFGVLCAFQYGADANKKDIIKKYLRKLPKKLASQLDRGVGDNVIRADKKGGRIMINRRGHVLEFKLMNLAEFENGTEKANIAVKDIDFTMTKDKNDTRYGIDSAFMEVKGVLANGGNLTIQMFMFRENGTITGDDGNEYDVAKGGTKVNIEIDWPQTAQAIDLHLGMKCDEQNGKRAAKLAKIARGRKLLGSKSKNPPKTMDVCAKARVTFSPSYTKDTNDVDMADEYPLAGDTEDGYVMVKLRFAGKNIIYDPTMEVGDDIDNDTDSDSSATRVNQGFTVMAVLLFSVAKLLAF